MSNLRNFILIGGPGTIGLLTPDGIGVDIEVLLAEATADVIAGAADVATTEG